jgi:hypothetical protein
LERLFHLGAHVTLADAIAVDIPGQLAGDGPVPKNQLAHHPYRVPDRLV